MKKILIGILIILLIVMAYFVIFKGISIGSFNVLSVKQIQEENDNLTQEISQTETLMYSNYNTKNEELNRSVQGLMTAKEEYLDLTDVSTEGEIKKANRKETYKIEYLWTRIGSHATAEGVILKLDILAGSTGEADVKNLSFSVTGNYIAVINFVTAIEDDAELGFRIENFKILPGSDTDGRQATFTVKNVRIKQEITTSDNTNNEKETTVDSKETEQGDNNTNTAMTTTNENQAQ